MSTGQHFDELLGCFVDKPVGTPGPIFIIHDRSGGALACATSYIRAREIQLTRGWLHNTTIREY